MDYGKHCHECGRLDFSPLDCRKCGQIFCGEHREHKCIPLSISENHRSSSIEVDAKPPTITREPPRKPISSPKTSGTTKPTILKAGDTKPQKLGGNGQVKSERAVAALQRLKGLLGSSPARVKKSQKGPTPEQKRQAIGDLRVPQSDRIYLEIERLPTEVANTLTNDKTSRPSKTVWMFFDRSLNAGQILDRAAKQLGVINGVSEAEGRLIDVHRLASDFEGTKLHLLAT